MRVFKSSSEDACTEVLMCHYLPWETRFGEGADESPAISSVGTGGTAEGPRFSVGIGGILGVDSGPGIVRPSPNIPNSTARHESLFHATILPCCYGAYLAVCDQTLVSPHPYSHQGWFA